MKKAIIEISDTEIKLTGDTINNLELLGLLRFWEKKIWVSILDAERKNTPKKEIIIPKKKKK